MPDIELRFHRDMLILSAPLDAALARQGIDAARDRQYLNLMEPDVVTDALRMELVAGAQCVVTPTEDITRARLAHVGMEGDPKRLAQAALGIAAELQPQHILAEIGPCGLPLDGSSKASLNENRAQYADAARAFGSGGFDAFLLNGFTDLADLKCALMGVSQSSAKPIFASVTLGKDANGPGVEQGKDAGGASVGQRLGPSSSLSAGRSTTHPADREQLLEEIASSYPLTAAGIELVDDAAAPPAPAAYRKSLDPDAWPEALDTMVDLGASVVGFETADRLDLAVEYVRTAVKQTSLPVLAQLRVSPPEGLHALGLVPVEDVAAYTANTLEHAAVKLYGAGAQFLRATGQATPACTGALAVTLQGLDVRAR